LAVFILLRKNRKIAFVMRSNTAWMNGYYGLPSGKVEVGERALAAAVREAKEEAGVTIREQGLSLTHIAHRFSEDDTLSWIDLLFEVDSWQGEPYNSEPSKHSELAWLDIDNLPDNIVPSVRFELEQIQAGNIYSEYGWE
jgi:8-oxo-dGTP diphosphatase